MAASSWKVCCRLLRSAHDLRFLKPCICNSYILPHIRRFSRISSRHFAADNAEAHDNGEIENPLQMNKKKLRRMKMETMQSNWSDPEMERAAREGSLLIPLKEVHKEWLERHGSMYIQTLAHHYGIFDHLFGGEEFVPQPMMYVNYAADLPVYYGTFIKPSETTSVPMIRYNCPEDSLWTVVFTNPDGHLQSGTEEVLHWMVGNVPGNEMADGETLCEYLPAIPVKGTGWHRFIFCLFEQTEKLDFSQYKVQNPNDLPSRTFQTHRFLSSYPTQLIPRAINWYQAEWDNSVSFSFTHTLKMKEPSYETEKILTKRQLKQIEVRKARQGHYLDM